MNCGKKLKPLFLIFTLLFVCKPLFSEEISFLEPNKIKETKDQSTVLEIKTNVFGADVYINEVYLGKTNLTVLDYLSGNYFLKVSKKGYETKKYQLEIQKGYHQTYYIELKALYGNLSLSNLDADALVFIDGRKLSLDLEEIAGDGQETSAGENEIAGGQETAAGEGEIAGGGQQTAAGESQIAGAQQIAAGEGEIAGGAQQIAAGENEIARGQETAEPQQAQNLTQKPKYSASVKIPVGEHEVLVRKFGCKDFYAEVTIQKGQTSSLEIKEELIDFEIKSFGVSKKSFNPEYKNSVGSVTFAFAVTASQPLSFYIKNSKDEIVFNHEWKEFNNWYQSIVWDGKDSDGNILPDGEYVASIQSRHYIFNQPVKIDTTISYPLFSICDNGIGIGDLPAVFASISSKDSEFGKMLTLPYFQLKPISKVTGDNPAFIAVKSNVGIVTTIQNNYEFNLGVSLYPGLEDGGLSLNGSFKLAYASKLGDFFSLTYGGLLRYGFTNATLYSDYIDNGSGFGLGALLGLDSKILKMELSSQLFFREKIVDKENPEDSVFYSVWKNGLTLSVKPVNVFSLYSWLTLENIDALDIGAGFNFMPAGTSILFDFNCQTAILFNSSSYLTFGIMLSYLF
ncbi:MAG: PEGA domain-containing protein [Treponema sp.]|nr:PEGA domain-containing protein [Treponema sp.]